MTPPDEPLYGFGTIGFAAYGPHAAGAHFPAHRQSQLVADTAAVIGGIDAEAGALGQIRRMLDEAANADNPIVIERNEGIVDHDFRALRHFQDHQSSG